MMMEF